MGTETTAAVEARETAEPRAGGAPPAARIENGLAGAILALVPAGLVLYFGFNGGGFFPGTVGFACVIVIQLLIVRVLLGDHPFAGFNRGVAIVGATVAGFATWVLASGLWADAEDRTLIEFDRALLYLLIFVLFALVARTPRRFPWMVRGLAVAILICCGAGLISRVLPHTIHTTTDIAVSRLAYPLTYWNALGLLAAVGIILFLGLSSSRREPRVVRALAAGAVPILAVTLYFTFSRGAILAVTLGIVVFLLAARARTLPSVLLATLPTTAAAIVAAYHADKLSSNTPTTAQAVSQGKHVASVVVICAILSAVARWALAYADRRLARIESTPSRVRTGRGIAAGALVLVVAVALAAGAPGWISREYNGFFHGPRNASSDLRVRLTDPSSNGRLDHWKAALQQFDAQPFHGSGAGTYEFVWHRRRKIQTTVVDGHSLYIEVMGELGIVGLLLIVAAVIGILVGIGRHATLRHGGRNRILYAAALGAAVAWAVQAGVDWLWEMPAVTAWVFAFGGAALAARPRETVPGPPAAQRSRVPIAAALIVMAALPALILFSQSRLQSSAHAFARGNCKRATKEAFSSIDQLSVRPEPYRIIGYCDIEQGRPPEAIAAMRKAVELSPRNWESHYGLATALAAAGRDPRPEIQRTLRMDPLQTFVKSAAVAFRGDSPAVWRRQAAVQMDVALSSGQLTFR